MLKRHVALVILHMDYTGWRTKKHPELCVI